MGGYSLYGGGVEREGEEEGEGEGEGERVYRRRDRGMRSQDPHIKGKPYM